MDSCFSVGRSVTWHLTKPFEGEENSKFLCVLSNHDFDFAKVDRMALGLERDGATIQLQSLR